MTAPYALPITRRLLRILVMANYLGGFFGLVLFIAFLLAPEGFMQTINIKPADATRALVVNMRLILVLVLASAPIMILLLERLTEIVDTVGAGNPFVGRNAQRLRTIGWMLLALNMLDVAAGVVIRGGPSDANALGMGWEFSFTPWLAVLLSFVLARVFELGARMHADLEGTV